MTETLSFWAPAKIMGNKVNFLEFSFLIL